jgi:hypothetical protein
MQLPSPLGKDPSLPAPMSGVSIGPLNVLAGETGVVNVAFPVGHIRRYGAIGNGLADDTAALQAAFTAGRTFGTTIALDGGSGPYSLYRVTAPINSVREGVTAIGTIPTRILGSGGMGPYAPGGSNPNWGSILVQHSGGTVFDCTGASDMIWDGVNVTVDVGYNPLTCWLFARSSIGGDCGRTCMLNCKVFGSFTKSIVYSYGAEMNDYISCKFFNTNTGALSSVFKFTGGNIDGLTSTFATIGVGTQSNLRSNIFGGNHESYGGVVYYLERHQRASIQGSHVRSSNPAVADGTALVYVDMSVGTSDFITLFNIDGENDDPKVAQYGVFFTNHVQSPTFFTIRDCYFPTSVKAIYAGANVTATEFDISGIGENNQRGIQFAGTLQTSRLDITVPLNVNSSSNNIIRMPLVASYLTLGQQNGGLFIDKVSGLGMVINSDTVTAGETFGAGAKGVLSVANGAQPAALGSHSQYFVVAGATKVRGTGGTITTIAPA